MGALDPHDFGEKTMLRKTTHIEGLEDFENADLANDHDPRENLIRFFVQAEEMPAKTREAGRRIVENFVWIEKIINLGNLIITKRIKDKVEFDEKTNKWRVVKLAKKSDIKFYPEQWNAFATGTVDMIIGTPLSVLFHNDPAKVETYKYYAIRSIEQLSRLSDGNLSSIPLEARKDREKAIEFLSSEESFEKSGGVISLKLEQKEKEIDALKAQLQEMNDRFLRYMEDQAVEESKPKKSNKKSKVIESDDSVVDDVLTQIGV